MFLSSSWLPEEICLARKAFKNNVERPGHFLSIQHVLFFLFVLYSVNWLISIILSIIPFHPSVISFVFPLRLHWGCRDLAGEKREGFLCPVVQNCYKFLGSKWNCCNDSVFCSFLSHVSLNIHSWWWPGLPFPPDNTNHPIKFLIYVRQPDLTYICPLLCLFPPLQLRCSPSSQLKLLLHPFSLRTLFLPNLRLHGAFIMRQRLWNLELLMSYVFRASDSYLQLSVGHFTENSYSTYHTFNSAFSHHSSDLQSRWHHHY